MTLRALQKSLPVVTLEEYLERERAAGERSEFHAGLVVGMAGGSLEHADAIARVVIELGILAKGTQCRVLSSEMGVWIEEENCHLYPDASILCGKPQFRKGNRRMLTNPKLIVEVLSTSSRDYDLAGKFRLYQKLASFDEYLVMEPDKVELHHWLKVAPGKWSRKKYTSRAAAPMIRALGKELKLADVYEGLG